MIVKLELTDVPFDGHTPIRRSIAGASTYRIVCSCGWQERKGTRVRFRRTIGGEHDVVSDAALDAWLPHTFVPFDVIGDLFGQLKLEVA